MNAYKEWMEEIEDRALDTLKQAINQLLITFEEKDNIKTYKKTKGSTKREQIEELMSLLTQEQESIRNEKRLKKDKHAGLATT